MPELVDPHHLLLVGAGPGVGAGVVRRFGREGFRSTLISRSETLDQLARELRSGGLEIEAIRADIEDLDGYRDTLEADLQFAGGSRCRRVQRCAARSRPNPRHHRRAAANRTRRRRPRRRRRGTGRRARPAGSWRKRHRPASAPCYEPLGDSSNRIFPSANVGLETQPRRQADGPGPPNRASARPSTSARRDVRSGCADRRSRRRSTERSANSRPNAARRCSWRVIRGF